MTSLQIQKLRQKIKDLVPQDRLVLLPGEFHVYQDPNTGIEFKSATTKLKVINNPIFQNWRGNRMLEKYDELIPQIKAGQITQDEAIKIAKTWPEEVFAKAGERGTAVHNYIHLYFSDWIRKEERPGSIIAYVDGSLGQPVEKDYAIWSALRCAEEWIIKSGFIPLASEIRVWSVKYKEAGTLDAIGIIGNDIVLIDWKTANELRDDYWLQIGCYYRCFVELTKILPKYGVIIKLDKEQGRLDKPEKVPQLHKRFEEFRTVSRMYDIMHSIRDQRKELQNEDKKIAYI